MTSNFFTARTIYKKASIRWQDSAPPISGYWPTSESNASCDAMTSRLPRYQAKCVQRRCFQCGCVPLRLEVVTPTPRPLSGRGCHALTWRSQGHSLAAYLWRHLRQTVVLPGKCTPDSALTG